MDRAEISCEDVNRICLAQDEVHVCTAADMAVNPNLKYKFRGNSLNGVGDA
jgi:hypothetical protein